jgi:head-tail adaptor
MAIKLAVGMLDRTVVVLARTVTIDPDYGTKEEGDWEPFVTVKAQVLDVLPSQSGRIADSISITSRPARVRMRWRGDVTQNNRFLIEGRTMKIISGPAELGRKDGMEFLAEELSTMGERP